MDSRERVIRALELTGPDRLPVMHRTLPGAFIRYGRRLEALYERYPSDVLLSPSLRAPFAHRDGVTEGSGHGSMQDAWGCIWQSATDDFLGQVVGHPLADWRALDGYTFPDPAMGRDIQTELVAVVRADRHRHYVLSEGGSLYHRYTFLRGMEQGLIDVIEGSREFQYVLERIVEFTLERVAFWCEFEEVDGIQISDDWGTQENLLINPQSWRRWFRPAYQRIVDAIHAGGKHAHLHSDGQILSILPDLIEIGWDEINPQVWSMDMDAVSRLCAGVICVRADLDRQWVLPFGAVADVEAHVRKTVAAFHRSEGGYIGYGQVGPDVPLENAEAMLRTLYAG
jgi:uroporphyrinogen decarboxylase